MNELEIYKGIKKGMFETLDDISFLDDVMDTSVIDDMLKDFDNWLANPLYDLDTSCLKPLFLEEGQEES